MTNALLIIMIVVIKVIIHVIIECFERSTSVFNMVYKSKVEEEYLDSGHPIKFSELFTYLPIDYCH